MASRATGLGLVSSTSMTEGVEKTPFAPAEGKMRDMVLWNVLTQGPLTSIDLLRDFVEDGLGAAKEVIVFVAPYNADRFQLRLNFALTNDSRVLG